MALAACAFLVHANEETGFLSPGSLPIFTRLLAYGLGAIGLVRLSAGASERLRWALSLVPLAFGAALSLALPYLVFSWPDSIGYISPALTLEAYGHLEAGIRELPYPWLLAALSNLGSPMRTVFVAQSCAGLIASIYLVLAWRALGRVLFEGSRPPDWYFVLGCLTVLAYAGAASRVYYEIHLMPEAIFPLFAAAAVCHLLAFISALKSREEQARAGLHAAVSIFLLLALYTVIPRWGFGVLMAAVPIVLVLRQASWSRRRKAAIIGIPLLVFAAGLVLPSHFYKRRALPHGDYFLQMHLFCLNAPAMDAEIQRELANLKPLFDPSLLKAVKGCIDGELTRSRAEGAGGPSPSLGYNPDNLIYKDSVAACLDRFYNRDPAPCRRFYNHFYWAAWRHQPFRMAAKIAHELQVFYRPGGHAASCSGYSISIAQEVADSISTIARSDTGKLFAASNWRDYPPCLASMAGAPGHTYFQSTLITALHWAIDQSYFWCVIAVAGVCLGLLVRRIIAPSPNWESCACPVIIGTLLAGFVFLETLTLAVVHSTDSPRYIESEFVFTAFSWGASIACLVVFLQRARGCREPSPAASATS